MKARQKREKERYARRKAANPAFLQERAAKARDDRAQANKELEEQCGAEEPLPGDDDDAATPLQRRPDDWWEYEDVLSPPKKTQRPWLYEGKGVFAGVPPPPSPRSRLTQREANLRDGKVLYLKFFVGAARRPWMQVLRDPSRWGRPFSMAERREVFEVCYELDAQLHWPTGEIPKLRVTLAPRSSDPPPPKPKKRVSWADEACEKPTKRVRRVRWADEA